MVGKIELRGYAGTSGRQYYLLLITVVRGCCCTLMLKETENEETRLFCQIFVIGGILIEGARAPWATPLATGYAYNFEIRSRS